MADDERRAEIEAMARALAVEDGDTEDFETNAGQTRDFHMRRAQNLLAALDRVRDARGDDLGARQAEIHARNLAWLREHHPDDPRVLAARSPQDEDHEAGIHVKSCLVEWCGVKWVGPGGVCPRGHDKYRVDLYYPSSSRDGSVAVDRVDGGGTMSKQQTGMTPAELIEMLSRWKSGEPFEVLVQNNPWGGSEPVVVLAQGTNTINLNFERERAEFSPASTGDQGPKEDQ